MKPLSTRESNYYDAKVSEIRKEYDAATSNQEKIQILVGTRASNIPQIEFAKEIAVDPNTPMDILGAIISKGGRARDAVIRNPSLTPDLLKELILDLNHDMLDYWHKAANFNLEIANHPNANTEVWIEIYDNGMPAEWMLTVGAMGLDRGMYRSMGGDTRISEETIKYILNDLKAKRKIRIPEKVKETNVDLKEPEKSEELFNKLYRREELQYKYDKLKDEYKSGYPEDSKFPVIRFNLKDLNQMLIDHFYKYINAWKQNREELYRDDQMESLVQNRVLLETLGAAKTIEEQNIAIHKTLNTIHTRGYYLRDYMGMTQVQLDFLSRIDTSKWDKELERLSFVEYKKLIRSKSK